MRPHCFHARSIMHGFRLLGRCTGMTIYRLLRSGIFIGFFCVVFSDFAYSFAVPSPNQRKSLPLKRARQDGRWMGRYNELVAYKESFGHTDVPKRDESSLGLWVYTQRRQYRLMSSGERSNMTQQRLSLLRDIGFDFEPASKVNHPKNIIPWDERFQELLEFKKIYGHTNVPPSINEKLSRWVAKQRYYYKSYAAGLKQSTLDEEKVNRLKDIGFEFRKRTRANRHVKVLVEDGETIMKRYRANLEAVKSVYKKRKHIDLPQTQTYSVLNDWYKEIRKGRGKQLIDSTMRSDLDKMGFDWTGSRKPVTNPDAVVVRLKWVDRYRELRAFKKANKHCNVPEGYQQNSGLAKWVKIQREEYHQLISGAPSKLTDKRLEALEFIDFDFYDGYDVEDGEDYVPLFQKPI